MVSFITGHCFSKVHDPVNEKAFSVEKATGVSLISKLQNRTVPRFYNNSEHTDRFSETSSPCNGTTRILRKTLICFRDAIRNDNDSFRFVNVCCLSLQNWNEEVRK